MSLDADQHSSNVPFSSVDIGYTSIHGHLSAIFIHKAVKIRLETVKSKNTYIQEQLLNTQTLTITHKTYKTATNLRCRTCVHLRPLHAGTSNVACVCSSSIQALVNLCRLV